MYLLFPNGLFQVFKVRSLTVVFNAIRHTKILKFFVTTRITHQSKLFFVIILCSALQIAYDKSSAIYISMIPWYKQIFTTLFHQIKTLEDFAPQPPTKTTLHSQADLLGV